MKRIMTKKNDKNLSVLPGLAAIGLLATGVVGIFHAFQTGSGTGLIASAIAFGALLVVAFI